MRLLFHGLEMLGLVPKAAGSGGGGGILPGICHTPAAYSSLRAYSETVNLEF